jgi:CheY-like chemotaxis protein
MVNNGQEAVDICKSEVFDIILMDLQMPVMNGYDATIHIRNSDNQNKNIPIIALTASAMKDQMDKSIDSGMNDFLTKPFTPTQLKDQLSKYIYFS